MTLDALAIFRLVAVEGGFGRAARASSRPKATLSRQVADLERSLGRRLFERGGGSLRLTQEGRQLLAGIQGPLDELMMAESAMRDGNAEPRGRLRVNVPLLIASHLVGGIAARFHTRYPKVRLEVLADDRTVDLIAEGYDVTIRTNPRPDEDLVGRCFLREPLLVVASPTFERPRAGAGGEPVTVPAIVRAIGDGPDVWLILDGATRYALRPDPVLRLSTLAIRDAVLAGAGVALLPNFVARDLIASGRLVTWGSIIDRKLEFWVLHASARLASEKVRAFVQFMVDAYPDASPALIEASRSVE